MTSAPAAANARAMARPRPRVPPVMSATRPDRSNGPRPPSRPEPLTGAPRSRAPVGAAAPGRTTVRGELEDRAGVAGALGDGAGLEQQLQVADHLPDDEQRLLRD